MADAAIQSDVGEVESTPTSSGADTTIAPSTGSGEAESWSYSPDGGFIRGNQRISTADLDGFHERQKALSEWDNVIQAISRNSDSNDEWADALIELLQADPSTYTRQQKEVVGQFQAQQPSQGVPQQGQPLTNIPPEIMQRLEQLEQGISGFHNDRASQDMQQWQSEAQQSLGINEDALSELGQTIVKLGLFVDPKTKGPGWWRPEMGNPFVVAAKLNDKYFQQMTNQQADAAVRDVNERQRRTAGTRAPASGKPTPAAMSKKETAEQNTSKILRDAVKDGVFAG